ncbi:MAG: MFS transporter [Blastocatellia bacterium]
MSTSAMDAKSGPAGRFYGWRVVGIAWLTLLIGNGLTVGGLPAFTGNMLRALIEAGTLTREAAPALPGAAATLMIVIAGITAPLIGALVGRVNIRALICAGCVLLGTGLGIYSRAVSPRHIYLAYGVFGLTLGLAGLMMNTVLVSNWFVRHRGRAIGILVTGTSFGGMLIPLAANVLIPRFGWRAAVLILSGLVWFVLLPAILLVVRAHPRDLGQAPDGDPVVSRAAAQAAPLGGASFAEALRTPLFWSLGIGAAAIFYAIFTSSQQFILYLQTPRVGMPESMARIAQGLTFAASVGGKYFFGWLGDRMSRTRTMLVCCSMMFAGTLILLKLTAATAFAFILFFGVGFGGTFALIQLLAISSFGLRDAGKIMGVITFLETLGSGFGSILTGMLAKADNGDYQRAFYGVILAATIALIASFVIHFQSEARSSPSGLTGSTGPGRAGAER